MITVQMLYYIIASSLMYATKIVWDVIHGTYLLMIHGKAIFPNSYIVVGNCHKEVKHGRQKHIFNPDFYVGIIPYLLLYTFIGLLWKLAKNKNLFMFKK